MVRLAAAAVAVFTARGLGPVEYGKMSTALAFVGLFGVLFDFGTRESTIRRLSSNDEGYNTESLLGTTIAAKLLISLVAVICTLVASALVGYDYRIVGLIGVALIGPAVGGLLNPYHALIQVRGQFVAWSRWQMGLKVIALAITLSCLAIGLSTSGAYVWVISLEMVAVALVSVCVSGGWVRPVLRWMPVRRVIQESLPFGLSILFVTIYLQVDTVILSTTSGFQDVGFYSAAYKLYMLTLIIPEAVYTVMLPRLFADVAHGMGKLFGYGREFSRLMLVVGTPVAIVLALIAQWIFPIILGPDFSVSANILRVLGLAVLAKFMGYPAAAILTVTDRQVTRVSIQALVAVVNLGLNLLILPRYGALGAAWTTVISECVLTTLYIRLTDRSGERYLTSLDYGSICVAVLFVVAALHATTPIQIGSICVAFAVAYTYWMIRHKMVDSILGVFADK